MSGLVNYSSGDEQDDYQYTKAGEQQRQRERGARQMKHRRRSKSSSSSSSRSVTPPPRKDSVGRSERSKSGLNTSYNNDEDKYKSDKRSEKYNDQRRDKRDVRDSNKYFRDNRGGHRGNKDDSKEYDNGHWHDSKKNYDNKRHSKEYKRDNNKRDSGAADYYRDEKRSRYDDKKYSSSSYTKERFNTSKPRYDERKSYEDRKDERHDDKRSNDGRRNTTAGNNKRDYEDRKDRRSNNDDRRSNNDDRRSNNDDRRAQRSYNQDRSSSYRTNNKFNSDRRVEDDRKVHHTRSDSPDKASEQNSSHKEYTVEARSSRPEESKSSSSPDVVVVVEKKILPTARNFEALLSLPLSETALKQANVVTVPPIATSQDVDAAATTVQLPSYYNPKVINPNKYAQQMQKRKLIWGAKKTEDAASKWGHAQFSQDSDGKVASKFMRLMGIKSPGSESNNEGEKKPEPAPTSSSASNNPDFKSREAMFSSMEQQYEVARQVTHTMRGVGLGFSSQNRPY